MQDFEGFFQRATGFRPYGFQRRIARDGLPDEVAVPTGAGKSAVILAWLWRRLHGPDPVRARTPRRLIWVLPQRSLTEPVAGQVRTWLANLGLTEEVALYVAQGTRADNLGDWRTDMHQPAIIVGTADSLVSTALNRGFGLGRTMLPVDFALVTNGAHWIIDEARLCPQTAATLKQIARFAQISGTTEPFGLTLMSALAAPAPVGTAGHTSVEIQPAERAGELAVRLGASRIFRRLAAEPGDYRVIAASALKRHARGTLTLVVLNTVATAQRVYQYLRGGPVDVTLLHSRLRGGERAERVAAVLGRPADRIVVVTQVVEASVDVDAALLITEVAPWPSLVLRAGRCNRTGLLGGRAEVLWVPPVSPSPYAAGDVDSAVASLAGLDGRRLTSEELLAAAVSSGGDETAAISWDEFVRLFDTSVPDHVDVAPYVRDGVDLDVDVAWATWTPGEDGAPDPEVRYPPVEYRCRVPIGDAVKLAESRVVWRLDEAQVWTRFAGEELQVPLRPGELLLVSDSEGGYDPATGFDLSALGPVADCPEILTPDELAQRATAAAAETTGSDAADVAAPPSAAIRPWQSLDEHSQLVRDQAAALVAVLAPQGLSPEAARSVVIAGWLHDAGKAHPIWQDALCALAEEGERAEIAAGRPWAKSGGRAGRLEFAGGAPFRHEFASLLLIDGPLRELLSGAPDQDLVRYLVLAHHGKLRVRIPDLLSRPDDLPDLVLPKRQILGLEQGATADIPAMLGLPATALTVDLRELQLGGDRSWTRTVLGLRDTYGPFVLTYLETVVRVADWRASGGRELPAND